MLQVRIKVPCGHQMVRRTNTVDIDTAVKILSTKKQRKYSYAVRSDSGLTADLVQHFLVCPFCKFTIPSYSGFLNRALKTNFPVEKKVPKNVIEDWGSRQLSMFDSPCANLYLNRRIFLKRNFVCPKCGRESELNYNSKEVVIEYKGKKVMLSCKVSGIEELLSLQWLSGKPITITSNIFEVITFNLRNGHTFIKLVNSSGKTISNVYDITEDTFLLASDPVSRIIETNTKVARTLKRLFSSMNGGKLPFSAAELGVKKYILMTRFIGYDRMFYDAIPYAENSCKLDGKFERIAMKLHTKRRAVKYLDDSCIPDLKSIRRLYFLNPGLLFYLPEGESLWKIIEDSNLFCRILSGKHIYEVLTDLHQRPALFEFLSDYSCQKGKTVLVKKLLDEWRPMKLYAISYCSLSDAAKREEQKSWRCRKHFSPDDRPVLRISHPLCEPDTRIKDCIIDGFRFYWLRTSLDYNTAARELNNCLSSWLGDDNPVVCIKMNEKIVAAIEVQGNTVIQLLGWNNSSIDRVKGLTDAYEKWKHKYRLTEEKDFDFDDDF